MGAATRRHTRFRPGARWGRGVRAKLHPRRVYSGGCRYLEGMGESFCRIECLCRIETLNVRAGTWRAVSLCLVNGCNKVAQSVDTPLLFSCTRRYKEPVSRLVRSPLLPFLVLLIGPLQLAASVHSGSVRAADHFIPGATVTARQGTAKVLAYTDENGRYSLELTPGNWDVSVEILGFTTQVARVSGDTDSNREWAMEMPRIGDPTPVVSATTLSATTPPAAPTATAPATPATATTAAAAGAAASPALTSSSTQAKPADQASAKPAGAAKPPGAQPAFQGRNRNGRTGQPRPGFQSASVKATDEGQQALSQAASAGATIAGAPGDAEETMMVQGSTSGGLAAASDDENRRQRFMQSRGGGGEGNPSLFASGMGDTGGQGMPPGMNNGSGDSLGPRRFWGECDCQRIWRRCRRHAGHGRWRRRRTRRRWRTWWRWRRTRGRWRRRTRRSGWTRRPAGRRSSRAL